MIAGRKVQHLKVASLLSTPWGVSNLKLEKKIKFVWNFYLCVFKDKQDLFKTFVSNNERWPLFY